MRKLTAASAFVLVLLAATFTQAQSSCVFYGMTYGNGLYVAVGCAGEIDTSSDGVNWKPVTYSQTPNDLNAVAYGGGTFVAVGDEGWTAISPDGVNWTSVSTGVTVSSLRGIAYGNGQFVAVGESGTVITSATGQGWTLQPLSTADVSDPLTAIIYTNNLFVAIGSDSGVSYSSTDGVTWTQGGNGLTGNYYSSLAYGNGVYVAANLGGQLFASADGANWAETADTATTIGCVAYGGGIFVAGANSVVSYASPDGSNWTAVASPPVSISGSAPNFHAMAFNAGDFYFAGDEGNTASAAALSLTPPVGTKWTISSYDSTASDTNDNLKSVVFGAAQFVAIGSDSQAAFESVGGEDWNQESNSLSGDYYRSVAYGNGIYVAVNDGGQIFVLTNDFDIPGAATWTESADSSVNLRAVSFGDGEFVAVGGDGSGAVALTSTDGFVWTQSNLGVGDSLNAILCDGSRFVAAGDGGTVVVSPDGSSWTQNQFPNSRALYGIAYGSGLYAVVGEEGTIFTSPDAATWTAPTNYLGTPNDLNAIVYNNNLFIAVGGNGWMVTSTDGTNWISRNSPTVNNLAGAAYGNGSFVVVGGGGVILTVNQLPILLTEPPATIYLKNGSNVTLTASVGGAGPFTFQWQFGGVNLANSANVIGATSNVLTLTNVDLTFSGQYMLIINNGYGSITTRVVTVNIGNPPIVWTQPINPGNRTCGVATSFEVAGVGSSPLSFTWIKKGGRIIGGQVSSADYTSTLTFPHVTPTNAGSYYAVISNPYGEATSDTVNLTAILEKDPPTIHITSPTPNLRATSISMTGTASDGIAVAGVHYKLADAYGGVLDSGPATLDVPGGKVVNWTVPFHPNYASNVLTVIVSNYSGITATSSVSFFYLVSGTFNLIVESNADKGSITGKSFVKGDTAPAVGQTVLIFGDEYQLTATPNTNWHFTGWTAHGNLFGVSNTVNFTMGPDLVISTGFASNSFADFAGAYDGTYYVTTNAADLIQDKAGFISLNVLGSGHYTGKFRRYNAVVDVAFSGDFDAASGSATNHLDPDTTLILNVDYQSLGPKQARQILGSVVGRTWGAELSLIADFPLPPHVTSYTGDFLNHAFLLKVSGGQGGPLPQGYGGGVFRAFPESVLLSTTHRQYALNFDAFEISDPLPSQVDRQRFYFSSPPSGFFADDRNYLQIGEDGALPILVVGNGSAIFGRLTMPTAFATKTQLATNLNVLSWVVAPGADALYTNGFVAGFDVISDKTFAPAADLATPHFATISMSGGGLTNTLNATVKIANTSNQRTTSAWLSGAKFILYSTYSPTNGQFALTFTNALIGRVKGGGQMLTGPSGEFFGAGSFVGATNDGVITITPNP